jgi:hypothetical protein
VGRGAAEGREARRSAGTSLAVPSLAAIHQFGGRFTGVQEFRRNPSTREQEIRSNRVCGTELASFRLLAPIPARARMACDGCQRRPRITGDEMRYVVPMLAIVFIASTVSANPQDQGDPETSKRISEAYDRGGLRPAAAVAGEYGFSTNPHCGIWAAESGSRMERKHTSINTEWCLSPTANAMCSFSVLRGLVQPPPSELRHVARSTHLYSTTSSCVRTSLSG